jgi:imidazolonepropionase
MSAPKWDLILVDAHAAAMTPGAPYGLVRDAALAIKDGRIAWIGPQAALPGSPEALAREVRPLGGLWITPGLIDCHTHLVFGGNRAQEWEQRLNGATYEEIARAGGGILSTVRATRGATEEELAVSAGERLDALTAQGVTTVEIKSGYGLNLRNEVKCLKAAGRLASRGRARVVRTLLAAHAIPPKYRDRREDYVEMICAQIIPIVARDRLAEAVDAFCETIGFTPQEVDHILSVAAAHGLKVKLHAEQLSDQGAAQLAAKHGALSADHLEYLSEDGVEAMARAGTVAVLLPGAFHFLREDRKPPVEALRRARVPMAVATDCNPGTSPTVAPLLMLNFACTLFRLTPEEALAGMTRNAALALGLQDEIGTLEVGKAADLAVWRVEHPAELAYWMGANLLAGRYFAGVRAD